jgi:hypothetical protein
MDDLRGGLVFYAFVLSVFQNGPQSAESDNHDKDNEPHPDFQNVPP